MYKDKTNKCSIDTFVCILLMLWMSCKGVSDHTVSNLEFSSFKWYPCFSRAILAHNFFLLPSCTSKVRKQAVATQCWMQFIVVLNPWLEGQGYTFWTRAHCIVLPSKNTCGLKRAGMALACVLQKPCRGPCK